MYFVETEEVSECCWWAIIIRFGGFAPFFVPTWVYIKLYRMNMIWWGVYVYVEVIYMRQLLCVLNVIMCIRAPHSEISLCFTATLMKMQCFKWRICTATTRHPKISVFC